MRVPTKNILDVYNGVVIFNKNLRYDNSTTKDGLGRSNHIKDARLKVIKGRAYLMFRHAYEDCLSQSTYQELTRDGWREYHSHCLMKDIR